MDEKVLDLLIERVETSSHWYTVHKNDAWKDCLESDKERLKKYIVKNTPIGNSEEIPVKFKFVIPSRTDVMSDTVYTAIRYTFDNFSVSWDDGKTTYSYESVVQALREKIWVIID